MRYTTKLSGFKKDVLHTPIHGLASAGGVGLISYPFYFILFKINQQS